MSDSSISTPPLLPPRPGNCRGLAGGALAAIAAVLALSACAKAAVPAAKAKDPVTVEKIAGSDLSRLTLDARAAERIGLETRPVGVLPGPDGQAGRTTIPYGALLYDAKGTTFVYTNPEPLVFVRHPVVVDVVTGDTAMLTTGPPENTAVVSVGGAELVGIEFGVGK
ncbi:MAG TPA: hypothetical protein VM942_11415 [Acidimicrobiales bacterium]|nr:hypothetical protein [Acidimicrobiales bacterium]